MTAMGKILDRPLMARSGNKRQVPIADGGENSWFDHCLLCGTTLTECSVPSAVTEGTSSKRPVSHHGVTVVLYFHLLIFTVDLLCMEKSNVKKPHKSCFQHKNVNPRTY